MMRHALLSLVAVAALSGAAAFAQPPIKVTPMHATGTFDVKTTAQTADSAPAKASGLGRLSLDKQFVGALQASGQGEMLAAGGGGGSKSGAYVALEKVDGTLDGRRGSFVLVHRALMVDGTPQEWTVTVVPGSGTDELEGLSGSMQIRIDAGQHRYDLSYTLPGA